MDMRCLSRKIVVDETGKPVEVIISYEQFIDFVETYGLDLTENERSDLLAIKADIANGDLEDFITADEVDRVVGCTG